MSARRGWIVCAAGVALVLGSCSKEPTAYVEPPVPGEIVGVHPSPRSRGVELEPEIWIQFSTPIEDTLLEEVRLSLDGNEIRVTRRLEDAARRIVLRPVRSLALGRTHRVSVGDGLRTREGGSIGGYRWFFQTTGVRVPEQPFPAVGTTESPFVRLSWAGAGEDEDVEYRVYAGPDSERVKSRADVPIVVRGPSYVPRRRWSSGSTLYWAVTMRNLRTSEAANGPLWSCGVLGAEPTHQIQLEMADWSSVDAAGVQECFEQRIKTGEGIFKTAIRWDLRGLEDLRVARATIIMTMVGTAVRRVSLYEALTYWNACDIEYQGEPARGLVLAEAGTEGNQITLSSEALSARVEAIARFQDQSGFILTASRDTEFNASSGLLIIDVYDLPAGRPSRLRPQPRRARNRRFRAAGRDHGRRLSRPSPCAKVPGSMRGLLCSKR